MQVTLIRLNTATQETVETRVDIDDRVVLGRHLTSPLLLQGEALSRQHFALVVIDDQLMVENLRGNGTKLNGEALPAQEPSPLQSGDLVEIPGYEIRIELREAVQAAAENKAPVWQTYSKMVLGFFDPLEITLLVCALACVGLFAYYITT